MRPAVRLLVIRRRYVGDIVLLESVFRNLRAHWPESRIVVAIDPAYRALPALHPAINGTLLLPTHLWEWPPFLFRMRREKFTHVLDFDNRPRSALITFLSGAHLRATLRHGQPPRLGKLYTHRCLVEGEYLVDHHITDFYHRLLREIGVAVSEDKGLLSPSVADLEYVRGLPELAFLPRDRPRLLVHPGSRSAFRVWPALSFAAVCDALQTEHNVSVVLVASPAERKIVDAIRVYMRTPVTTVQRPLTLSRLAALFSTFDLVLCHDSGPMHLAASVGTRVVALFGSQNKANWHPLGPGHITLQPPLPCVNCVSPGVCNPNDAYFNHCVRNITVPEVIAAVRTQLQTLAAAPQ